jgi:predicted phage terminase large subunit-like protein
MMSLTKEQELQILLDEYASRGKDPVKAIQRRKIAWPISSEGYFTKSDGTFYEPSDNQSGFVRSSSYFSAYIGPRGSGKSAGGAQKGLRKLSIDNGDGAVLNPSFTNFRDSTWPEFREWIPWEMVVPGHRYRRHHHWKPQQPFTLSFINGKNVICKGLHDPSGARGPNINWLWFDEAQEDKTGEAFKIAIASVRVGKNPQAFVTATPAGKQHWMYDFFVKQDLSPMILQVLEELGFEGDLIDWYHGTREDNKEHLDKMYVVSLMAGYAGDSYLYKQEVEGLFVSPEGTIGDRHWFDGKILKKLPETYIDDDGEEQDFTIEDRVRYWDLAATEKKIKMKKGRKDPDETCGTLMSWDGDEDFYIEDQVHGRWLYEDILDRMHKTAIKDGPFVKIFVEQEPGAGGKNQVAAIQKFFKEGDADHIPLQHYKVEGHRPEGDKVMRANIWFPSASRGHMWMIEGDWNEPCLDQIDVFADGDYDDHVDSISGARLCVAPIIGWASPSFMKL